MATETVPGARNSASESIGQHMEDISDVQAMLAGARELLDVDEEPQALAMRLLSLAGAQLAELRNQLDELGLSLSQTAREVAHG